MRNTKGTIVKITLEKLSLTNFKGIPAYTLEPNGGNITVFAENGRGKTTLKDGFSWLMYDKNSDGKSKFDNRPLDKNNVAIKGLEVKVVATFNFDGQCHDFQRVEKEHVVKDQLKGFTSVYKIDDVPKSETQFKAYIAEHISEDIFKMLTDLQKFNTMHWTDRRTILMDIAGPSIGTPTGFTELTSRLKGRSMADYKKVLSDKKKAYSEERDDINPRLDEIHKGLGELEAIDAKAAGNQRAAAITEKADLQEQKQTLLDGETKRQAKIAGLAVMRVELGILENTLKQGDPSKIGPLLRKKLSWEETIAVKRDELTTLRTSISNAETALTATENQLTQKTQRWSLVCDEYRALDAAEFDETCSACGRALPADKIAGLEKAKTGKMETSATLGKRLRAEKEVLIALRNKQREHRDELAAGVVQRETELAKLLEEKESGIAAIKTKIAAYKEGVDPKDDDEWKRRDKDIQAKEAILGPSLAAGMGVIDKQIEDCQEKINAANAVLANTDTIKKNKDRIAELEAREKELAQLIADIDSQLSQIGEYKAEESRLIEAAVNGKFKHVKFKLFETLLNGSIEDTCVAMLDGKPYPAMSSGEKIFVGIDIVNVLSDHYGVSVVMFIDHLESLTLPIETDAQVIGLFAEKGTTELTVKGN